MIIKTLAGVATKGEQRTVKNVRWRKLSSSGKSGFAQKATITAIWKQGCSLITRHNLLAGESIWLQAKDELGQTLLSLVGIVTWSENCYRANGYRCELRFRELAS